MKNARAYASFLRCALNCRRLSTGSPRPSRLLITGSLGQLGQGLGKLLRSKYGQENVIMSDIVKPTSTLLKAFQPYLFLDVNNAEALKQTITSYKIDSIIHFSALLSAIGETNVEKALRVNVDGVTNAIKAAQQHSCSIFVPSTIGSFGPTTPRQNTPDVTIQRPTTIYGVSKVYAELLGEYYHRRFGVDFRSLRLPGIISADTQPGGGTTDYAVKIFHDALETKRFECYLKGDSKLPMMYIDDCLRAIVEFIEAPSDCLKQRTYNLSAVSFCPEEIGAEIRKHVDGFQITYNVCPTRQAIASSWPESLDDSAARRDWKWAHKYGLRQIVSTMLTLLRK